MPQTDKPGPDVGDKAPAFSLQASTGEKISLADLKGKPVVLYFYPKADTPGCTKEACSFRDALPRFQGQDAVILGVSPDPIEDVRAFAEKYQVNFPLLADPGHKIADKYGVWGERTLYGRKFMGIARTTVLIDSRGIIAHVFRNVRVEGHEQKVLDRLSQMQS